jgi:hypothetical protein
VSSPKTWDLIRQVPWLILFLVIAFAGFVLIAVGSAAFLWGVSSTVVWLRTFPLLHMLAMIIESARAIGGVLIVVGIILAILHVLVGWPYDLSEFLRFCRWVLTPSTGQRERRVIIQLTIARIIFAVFAIFAVWVWDETFVRDRNCEYLRHHGHPDACIYPDPEP